LPPAKQDRRVKICLWSGPSADASGVIATLPRTKPPIDLTPLTKGGKARWTETITTKGKRGDDSKGPYVIDEITVPFDNPYKSWMRVGGFDFFSDGRAAVCTWSGDVWIVSGINDGLEKITWKRFATGLFQPLGLKIVKDQVYTLGRDGVTRLHDLNGDGEADFYECFNNDVMVTKNFHEFIFDLHTDAEGNFYFVKGGPVLPGGRGWDKVVPHHGCLFKVSRDGSKVEVVARGFRAPNGMGVGPHGELTTGDNEGTWTPMCPINWIKPGGFYGVPDFSDRKPRPTVRDNPLCWMPKEVDNSSGGQVWITGNKFGPLSGQLLHTSYGTSTLFNVLKEEVGGQMQGGVVPVLKFDSGVCRVRFFEDRNALFLTGIRGWQTNATRDAGFYRVRYTGKKANLPVGLNVVPGAVKITFSDPLDRKAAEDVDNYNVQQWNYRWLENYGSPHFKVSDPKKQGHDDVEVESATLSKDGRTVTLKIDGLRPVMQMRIAYTLRAADGAKVQSAIHNTINVVGDQRGELHPGELRVIQGKE
jgi:glucose/arabinose dehydrogenase